MASGQKLDAVVADTHALLWYSEGHASLGRAARTRMSAAVDRHCLYLSAATIWEIAMLVRKGRIPAAAPLTEWWRTARSRLSLRLVPIDDVIALRSQSLPGDFHADPADRFIVATAIAKKLPLLTADDAILAWAARHRCPTIDARL